jgi:tripartite-type tricarboxylate transporter receptor subunit TctC
MVRSAVDFVKKHLESVIHSVTFESQFIISRPFVAPPGVPKLRIEELRNAFEKTMDDIKFIEDARKANIDINMIEGKDMENMIKTPIETETLNSLKQIYKVK